MKGGGSGYGVEAQGHEPGIEAEGAVRFEVEPLPYEGEAIRVTDVAEIRQRLQDLPDNRLDLLWRLK